jgi:ribosomal protein S18 acetylase RimI-like enzyme
MNLTFRHFAENDIDFALTQTEREGWDNTPLFFEMCLAHDPEGCFIAEVKGERVGMVTTTRFRETGWIGNLIVPPEHRHKGIGAELMHRAMGHLAGQGIRTIRLEADPPGIKLYRRLGFVDEFESARYRLDNRTDLDPGRGEPMTEDDLPDVRAFDPKYFGDDRARLLDLLRQQATTSIILRRNREVSGYAMTMPSAAGTRIGPWLAVDLESANDLLKGILVEASDTRVVLGIPEVNAAGRELLESFGFCRTPSCLRMRYGEPRCSGQPEGIFALANGAMG